MLSIDLSAAPCQPLWVPLHSAASVAGGAKAEGEDTGESQGGARVQGGPSKAFLDRRGQGIIKSFQMAVKESYLGIVLSSRGKPGVSTNLV